MPDKVFDAYSAYYDLFYRDKPYEQEVAWLVERMRRYQPGARTLLDVGCGTGAYTELFAQQGYTAQGVDLSPSMIAQATGAGGRASYATGDARSYRAAEPVDIVTLLFHVMSYQTTDDDVIRTLESCFANLRDGGLLCFDVWHKPAVLFQQPEERTKECRDEDYTAVRHAVPVHHRAQQVVDVCYDITVTSREGSAHFEEVHSMRYFDEDELRAFLTGAGFSVLEAAELVTSASPSQDTWGVCYFARKG